MLKQQEYVHRWDSELELERKWRKNTAIIFREFNRTLQNILLWLLCCKKYKGAGPLCAFTVFQSGENFS